MVCFDAVACLQCGEAVAKVTGSRYCSSKCFYNSQAGGGGDFVEKDFGEKEVKPGGDYVVFRQKFCANCGNEIPSRLTYCSKECQLMRKRRKAVTHVNFGTVASMCGLYVYGWMISGEALPFYVGMGQGNRATDAHMLHGRPAPCERVRRLAGDKFEAVIFRDNLTREGALLVESVLIELFNSMGACLSNEASGMRRQEVLPLEMPKGMAVCP